MKALLTSPINPISNSAYSHRSAQAEIYAQQIVNYALVNEGQTIDLTINYGNKETNYDQYDIIYVYHGNDWSGVLNLFGGPAGLSDKEGLVKLLKNANKVVSLVLPMPDYAALLRKRLKPGEKFGNVLDEMPEKYHPTTTSLSPSFEGGTGLVVGDSHAICMYRPGWDVLSVPFKTLHGALTAQGGLKQLITDRMGSYHGYFKNLEFYFGNIDIRHHLLRQKNPETATLELVEKYFDQVDGGFANADSKAIYEPLPIENESRKLPKTGYYKGTPFFGSWAERNEIREFFIKSMEQRCQNSDVRFIRWTDCLKNDKGELDFAHMEKPRSVHLARAAYPYWKGFKQPDAAEGLEAFF